MTYIGTSLPISNGTPKASGSLAYTGDMKLDRMLHAKLLLSPHPHAKIKSIDTAKAAAVPGVIAIFSHENTPATYYNSALWIADQDFVPDERLFSPVVRFVGDRVAAVVAVDEATAEHVVALIEVDYEELPAVFDIEEAFAARNVNRDPETLPIYENPISDMTVEYGNPDEAFARAHLVAEDRVKTPKTHHCAIENHVCLAAAERDGSITVHTPCQSVFAVKFIVAKALSLPDDRIRVIKAPTGGSFGGKSEPVLEPLCAFFSRVTKRPVMLQLDRYGSIVSTRTRNAAVGWVKTAFDKDGMILARDIKVIGDAGAYRSGGNMVVGAMARRLGRLYKIGNQRFRGWSVYTNTPVGGAYRGYGSSQIHAITEINLEHAARGLGMDPVELRLNNLVEPFDDDPAGGPSVGNARIIECVKEGAEAFDWKNKRNRPRRDGRRKRGVGMSCATHGNGHFGAFPENAAATLSLRDDGGLLLVSPLHDLGCGTVTIMQQIVAETVGASPEMVTIPEGDTGTCAFDPGSRASRVTYIVGECAQGASLMLKAKILEVAALAFNSSPEDLTLVDNQIRSNYGSDRQMSLRELAGFARQRSPEDISVTHHFKPRANPGSYAACFVEVEVDTLTGLTRVMDVVAVHDIGQPINLTLAEGQVHGGIHMGIGYALLEDLDIDPDTGQTKGNSLSRYQVLNAPEMPRVQVLFVESKETTGPYGGKALGEVATVPMAPAIVNAVNHALGTELTELPLTPERVVAGLVEQDGLAQA
ncbi:MAG: molybdopterin-dependent oxidoreductase [Rhodospirillales bacterium]|jgi:xanthine dehydrogenase molybdenum-binding subunit|nr:molybdopterin-dependent oxidoreductase [Rhodospirillales bacterium]